ncbi:hypothetical protein WICPIJ_001672 [Wickerhamomyces pijperi]|uniref:Secreted protein n=1 Tax=Wickerhamomyces pijperi TaxID=599730 RepID=A0A9P8QB61_WICPI|nr:hypothetical protein WICPIJ_001672 [Wickerhamomyces pijperi]
MLLLLLPTGRVVLDTWSWVWITVAVQVRLLVDGRIPALAAVQGHPIIDVIVGTGKICQHLVHQRSHVIVVWVLLKLQGTDIAEIFPEFGREVEAQFSYWRVLLLLTNLLMCVDGHVSGSTAERLAFSVRNVLFGLWVPVVLGHTEVDDMDGVWLRASCPANKEVVWLDVSENQVFVMDRFHSGDHLLGHLSHCLCRELAATPVKQIFKRRPQKINHQYVVETLLTKVVSSWNTVAAIQDSISSVFVSQLRRVRSSRLKLDSNLLVVQGIDTFKDDTERAFTDLFPHLVVDPHYV